MKHFNLKSACSFLLLLVCLLGSASLPGAAQESRHGRYKEPPGPTASNPVILEMSVNRIDVSPTGVVGTGREIDFRVSASPGMRMRLTIPNVVDTVPMSETSPGVYTGRYTVRKGVQVLDAPVLVQLRAPDGTISPLFPASQHLAVDSVAPVMAQQFPSPGDLIAQSQPLIYCALSDGVGIGIDPPAVRLQIDGYSVPPAQVAVTPVGLTYRPSAPLKPGDHSVLVHAVDRAGNYAEQFWHFTVVSPAPAPAITSITSDGQMVLATGDSLELTVTGVPGAVALFRVAPLAQVYRMTEVQPGRYTGTFTAHAGQSVAGGVVIAQFTGSSVQGGKVAASLVQPVTINAGTPARPAFIHPNDLDEYQGDLTFEGQALPGSLVRCTVSYDGQGEGGELPFSGTAFSLTAVADKNENWKMGPFTPDLRTLFARGVDTHFTVTAVTVDAAGNESAPVTAKLAYELAGPPL